MLLYVLLHFHTYATLRYCISICTSTHASGYSTVRCLALAHIWDDDDDYYDDDDAADDDDDDHEDDDDGDDDDDDDDDDDHEDDDDGDDDDDDDDDCKNVAADVETKVPFLALFSSP